MNTRPQSGFTVLELMVTIVVAGVILGIGIPNLTAFLRNNAMTSASNDFVTAVLAARGEAVKRQLPVTLCATTDPIADPPVCVPTGAGTNGAFFVWVDEDTDLTVDGGEDVLRRIQAPGGQIDVFMDGGLAPYRANGFLRNTANQISRILYCDDRGRGVAAGGLSAARIIQVQVTGRAEVLRDIALVDQGIADLTGAGVSVDCP